MLTACCRSQEEAYTWFTALPETVKNSATLTSRHIFSKLFTRSIGSIHYWGPKPCKWCGLRVYKVAWKRATGHTSTSSAFSLALEKHKVSEMRVLPLLLMDKKIKEAFKESSGYRGFRILWWFTGKKKCNGQHFWGIHSSDWGVSTLVLACQKKMDFSCTWNGGIFDGLTKKNMAKKNLQGPCACCSMICNFVILVLYGSTSCSFLNQKDSYNTKAMIC